MNRINLVRVSILVATAVGSWGSGAGSCFSSGSMPGLCSMAWPRTSKPWSADMRRPDEPSRRAPVSEFL